MFSGVNTSYTPNTPTMSAHRTHTQSFDRLIAKLAGQAHPSRIGDDAVTVAVAITDQCTNAKHMIGYVIECAQ